MSKTFYLHIGVPKTGTSSIQQTLFKNRDKLLQHDINYLALRKNHGGLFTSLMDDKSYIRRNNILRDVDTPEKADAYNETIRWRLTEEFSSNRSSKFVISGESLSGLSKASVNTLKQMLDPFTDGYRVIVYVRDPYDYVNSAAMQSIRAGRPIRQDDFRLPDYRESIINYIRVFGRENVDIRIFDPRRFVDGDLISDFLAALGQSPTLKDDLEIVRANKSLSHEAAMIQSETNIAIPHLIDGVRNPQRAPAFNKLVSEIEGEKFSIDPQAYLAREAEILEDLEWLHQELGEPVFGKPTPRSASVPRWGDATIRSIHKLVGEMVRTFRGLRAGLRSEEPDIVVPAGLEWLQETVNSAGHGPQQTQSVAAPTFDQATIRLLGCFIHDMALATNRLKRERASRADLRPGHRPNRKRVGLP